MLNWLRMKLFELWKLFKRLKKDFFENMETLF